MLAGGGVLPGRIFGRGEAQGLQLLNGRVNDPAHIDAGHGHGQQAHRGQHAETAAHIIGHHEGLPAVGIGQRLQHALVGVGGGEDVLVGLVAVFLLQQLPEDTEGDRRLQGSAGLGDYVHVEVHIPQPVQGVAQGIGGKHVAHEEDLGIVLAGQGFEQLDGAPGAQVGTADAHHHQCLGTAADFLSGSDDAVQLRVLDALGQLHPAGELTAQSGLVEQLFMGQTSQCVVRAGAGEKLGSAGQINLNHISS